jgi:phosphoglucomutase
MGLLAAEMTARTSRNPAETYSALTTRFGDPVYERIDAPASPDQKALLSKLSPDQITARELAGDPIQSATTTAPGNGAPIGGLKVTTKRGWFAARPSGTENVYKIYAESFVGPEHLKRLQEGAQLLIASVFDTLA